jgi:DUF1680 family protein
MQFSRRQMLQGVAATALALPAVRSLAAGGAAPANPSTAPLDPPKPKALPFNLADVRLLPGPFLDAQQRDVKYLLSLEPDRMLCNFRLNAGLQPKAKVYGGWESVQTWANIRCHGHTLGHYLSAVAMMFAATGNDEFKNRVDYIVSELAECQTAGKTGLINAFPDNANQFDNMVAGRRIVGVPWYTVHKIMAGLRDAFLYANSKLAKDVLIKFCDWAADLTDKIDDQHMQEILNTEHGGMNELLADVFAIIGDEKHLKLAKRFCHHAILDPFIEGRDTLGTRHSNTTIPKFIGFHRIYQLTGDASFNAAATFFWKTVTENRSFVTGGNGDGEHFFPPTDFAKHIPSAKTMETCCSYNMLKLTRSLFVNDPIAAYADYYERGLYNTILASQDPDSGMMTYFQSTRPGYMKIFCTPIDSFWCCTGTGMENHSKYGDSIYFKGDDGDTLFVNLFIPSTVDWKENGLALKQTTVFPEVGKTTLTVTAAPADSFTLQIRHPAWCKVVTISINGKKESTSDAPGGYVAIKRNWKAGDTVEVDLPMTITTEFLHGTTDQIAFLYGPIVLVGALGTEGMTPGGDIVVNERTIGSMMNQQIEVPTLKGDAATLAAKVKPADKPLTFTTETPGQPDNVTLVPYFSCAHQRYNMYWKMSQA